MLVGPIKGYFSKAGVVEALITDAMVIEGDEYVIIGPTTGVVKGDIVGLRVNGELGTEAPQGSTVTFAIPSKVRRSDRLFIMRPV